MWKTQLVKVAFRNVPGGEIWRSEQNRPFKAIVIGGSTPSHDNTKILQLCIYLLKIITFSILAYIYCIIKTMGFIMTFHTCRTYIPIILLLFVPLHDSLPLPKQFLFYFHVSYTSFSQDTHTHTHTLFILDPTGKRTRNTWHGILYLNPFSCKWHNLVLHDWTTPAPQSVTHFLYPFMHLTLYFIIMTVMPQVLSKHFPKLTYLTLNDSLWSHYLAQQHTASRWGGNSPRGGLTPGPKLLMVSLS